MKFKKATKDLDFKSNDGLPQKDKSPFAPKHYRDLKPNGFKIFTFNSGFKKKNDDLLIIIFDQAVNIACKYSLRYLRHKGFLSSTCPHANAS